VVEDVGSNEPIELLMCELIRNLLEEPVTDVIRIFLWRSYAIEFRRAVLDVAAVPYTGSGILKIRGAHF